MCERFEERSMVDVIEEFNKLKQTRSVESYQVRFEELRSLLIQHNPHLSETYFVSSYLRGHNEELRPMVKVLRPQTVEQAAESARLQELAVEALLKKQRQQTKGMVAGASISGGKGYAREPMKVSNGSRGGVGTGSLSYGDQLREQRRLAGLCFRCGDKYHVRHQCKR